MKKDVLKLALIIGIGFFMALIGYPFLHESGHIVASVLVGAEVLELTLFPVPSVLCDVTGVDTIGLVIIGFGICKELYNHLPLYIPIHSLLGLYGWKTLP